MKFAYAVLVAVLALPASALAAAPLDRAQRTEALTAAAAAIEARYVDPAKGARIAQALRSQAAHAPAGTEDGARFAEALTADLRRLSDDGHFAVDYSAEALPDEAVAVAHYDQSLIDRRMGAGVNYGVETVSRLDGGIGYLDLRIFAPPAMGGDVIAAAMTVLAQSDVLIIDLRRNTGGDADMTHLLAAYLLDEPRQMSSLYDRPSNRTMVATTPAWVPGRRFGGKKPVYVLVSHDTFSAAEAFAYDLQAMGRVIVVGETTGGGAHPFADRRLGPHLMLRLPEMRVVNPITGRDWEDVGVKPDVATPAAAALETALRLAKAKAGGPEA